MEVSPVLPEDVFCAGSEVIFRSCTFRTKRILNGEPMRSFVQF